MNGSVHLRAKSEWQMYESSTATHSQQGSHNEPVEVESITTCIAEADCVRASVQLSLYNRRNRIAEGAPVEIELRLRTPFTLIKYERGPLV